MRLLMAAFRLGQCFARHGEPAQIVSVADGDLLIFQVPQSAYGDQSFRNDARKAMGDTLKEIGARAIVLPESVKLTYVLKTQQGDTDTGKR